MINRCCFSLMSGVILLSAIIGTSSFGAVNTLAIDSVLKKEVLNNSDFQVIDKFVSDCVSELVRTVNFTEASKSRGILLGRRSDQEQYSQQMMDSLLKYIPEGFKGANALDPEFRQYLGVVNLLVLIDEYDDIRLLELAVDKINAGHKAISYWAVHIFSKDSTIRQLNAEKSSNLKLVIKATNNLKSLIEKADPEILGMIAKFGSRIDTKQAEELLFSIADKRIADYEQWQAQDELLDAVVLNDLYTKMKNSEKVRPEVGQRFGQLYSYVFAKYIKRLEAGTFSEARIQRLGSVLVEVEHGCLSRLLGPRMRLQEMVLRGDLSRAEFEYDQLFGSEAKPGELVEKLKCNFGKGDDGKARKVPKKLPAKPVK